MWSAASVCQWHRDVNQTLTMRAIADTMLCMTNSSIPAEYRDLTPELRALMTRMTELDAQILNIRDINDMTPDSRDLLCYTNSNDLTYSADDDAQGMINNAPTALATDFLRFLEIIRDRPHLRDILTEYALSLSLCPLHLIDYAICFDDDDDECAAIRTIHPTHDT